MNYIIYHQVKPHINCPDGITAAWIAKKAMSDAEIMGGCYQTPPPEFLHSGDRVVIVDFSFKAEVIEEWIRNGIQVEVLDHPKTAEEELRKVDIKSFISAVYSDSKIVFDMNECGATLTWKYFFPDKPMPPFLKYIHDRDLWKFEFPETRAVHEAMSHLGRSFELLDNLEYVSESKLLNFLLPIGEKLLQEKRQKCLAAIERAETEIIAGYQVPIVKLTPSEERLVSDICEIMYKETYPESLFVACKMTDGSYSLRSNANGSNFDVSPIARQFGGGGHQNSAGFKTT